MNAFAALVWVVAALRIDAEADRHARHAHRFMVEHPAIARELHQEAKRTGADEVLVEALIEEESEWRAHAINPATNAIGYGQHLLANEPGCRGPDGIRDEDCAAARARLLNGSYNLRRTVAAIAHIEGTKCRTLAKRRGEQRLCILALYGGMTTARAKRSERVKLILAICARLAAPSRSESRSTSKPQTSTRSPNAKRSRDSGATGTTSTKPTSTRARSSSGTSTARLR